MNISSILTGLYNGGYYLLFVILLLIALLVAAPNLNIPGNYKLYVVQSGSMEPAIKTKSIVIVKPAADYGKGNVITFIDPDKPKMVVTHRLVDIISENNTVSYITKGDANESQDTNPILKNWVIGKTLFSIPYLGYPVSFAKTQMGLIFIIIIPATLIIYSELMTIKNEAKRLLSERRKRKLNPLEKAEVVVGEEVMEVEKEIKTIKKEVIKDIDKLEDKVGIK